MSFKIRPILAVVACHAAHDTYTAFLPALLPVFSLSMGLSRTEAGLLAVCLQLPWLLQPWIGGLADRVSPRRFVIPAPAVSALSMCLLVVMPTASSMVPLLLLAGLSSASLHAVAPAVIGRLSGTHMGRGLGLWMLGGELGRMLGPLVVVTALPLLSIYGFPWLAAGGLAASAILWRRTRPEEIRLPSEQECLPWRQVLRAMAPLLVPLSGIMVARNAVTVALTLYLPLFLSSEGAPLWLSGASLAVVEAAGLAGALVGGSMSDRLGRRTVLALSLALTPILLVALVFAGPSARFPILLLGGFVGLSTTPVLMAMVQESQPQQRAMANGIYMALSLVVRSVVTLLLGVLADGIGFKGAFLTAACVALVALPLVLVIPGFPRAKAEPTTS